MDDQLKKDREERDNLKLTRLIEKSMRNVVSAKTININTKAIYDKHAYLIKCIGDELLLKEGKQFKIDEDNKDILRFMLYYFHGSEKALEVFPEYGLHKQLMLIGSVGVGKTLLMQIFSEYTSRIGIDSKFINVSTSQMMNYYKINNHLNQYTFNEQKGSFEGRPVNLCLNDLGLSTHQHFGQDLKELIKDFLYARNDLFLQEGKMAHITTNLNIEGLINEYQDEHGRLKDRFKTYNVIHLKGESKR